MNQLAAQIKNAKKRTTERESEREREQRKVIYKHCNNNKIWQKKTFSIAVVVHEVLARRMCNKYKHGQNRTATATPCCSWQQAKN